MKNKYLFWTPRILGILFAVFISLFAFDVFLEGYTFWQSIGAFFIHLLPTYLIIIALVVAWKWELPGGIVFIFLGILYMFVAWGEGLAILLISGPAFLTGILFILNKYLNKTS